MRKMDRTRTFPLRILVHSDMVGAIIGRSGNTITSITQLTKARIDVHREESPEQQEKIITINGDPECCSDACAKIIEIVQSERNHFIDPTNSQHHHHHHQQQNNRDITLKILAPNNLIGRLIGKSGVSIKKMMEQTQTKINICTNNITETTGEHTIVVLGELEQVLQAEKIISSKLRAAYLADMNTSLQAMGQSPYLFNNVPMPYIPNPYSQNSLLSSIVNTHAGAGSGAGHSHSAGGGGGGGGVVGVGGGSGPIPRTMPISPHQNHLNHHHHHHHAHQLPGSMYSSGPASYLPLYPNMNVPPTAPGILGYNPVVQGFDCERETVYIHVPASMVGAIIGKSGSAIKEMISTSGASIKVATPSTIVKPEHGAVEQQTPKEENNLESNVASSGERPDEIAQAANNLDCNEGSTSQGVADSTQQTSSSSSSPNNQANPKIMSRQQSSGSNGHQSSTRRVTIVGYPASQFSAQYAIYRKISIESGKGDISLMVEIYVPSQLVGRIIGRGGVTVKQLQKQTRTIIRLSDEKSVQQNSDNETATTTSSETCVQITGDFEGSQAAQRQIRGLIRESLFSRQAKSSPHLRNSESKLGNKNNSNNTNTSGPTSSPANNHKNSDDGNVKNSVESPNSKQCSKPTEKATDKMSPESDEIPTQTTEPQSCNCYHDSPRQMDKSQANPPSSPKESHDKLDEGQDRSNETVNEAVSEEIEGGGEGENTTDGIKSARNNNTINNNLNYTKQSINEQVVTKLKDHPGGDEARLGDCNHTENGEVVHNTDMNHHR